MDINPADFLTKVHCPVLAIFGENDTSIPVDKSVTLYQQYLGEAGNEAFTKQRRNAPAFMHGDMRRNSGHWIRKDSIIERMSYKRNRQVQEFAQLKSRLPTLWTHSYFVSTVGGAPLAIVKQYVENQKTV